MENKKRLDSALKAEKKYRNSVVQLGIRIKKDTADYNYINDLVSYHNCSFNAVAGAMVKYCIDNNIDIKSYIK